MNGLGFSGGVADAELDLAEGWLPDFISIDFIVNHFRAQIGASDAYIAGYLSVLYAEK